MILTKEDMVIVEIDPDDVDLIKHHINEAVNGIKTFKSWIWPNDKERQKKIRENQTHAQLANYAASIALTGSKEGWRLSRVEADKNPTKGDSGSDIFDYLNVDVKASAMRRSQDPLTYNLLVRPQEYHGDDWVYVCALIPKKKPWLVYVTGGCLGMELSKGVAEI